MNKPEILAPAGSYDALIAAVHNGCDAIYLGGQLYGARAYAKNFDIETMERGVSYAHKFGVKVYCTLNTLFKERELKPLLYYVEEVVNTGIDALIFQDLGVAKLIQTAFPGVSLHASTQMNCHSLEGVKRLEAFGFERVVLARELSFEEVKYISDNTEVELEAFVHGALCYSYSGQCLMSSFLGGRSGNRGRCAQPCRLAYESGDNQGHLLSPRDIETLSVLPQVIDAGIHSLKIEGRMKSPEYVGLMTKLYKKHTVECLEKGINTFDAAEREKMLQIFNRGDFSTGYYEQHGGPEMMAFDNPKHHGVHIGRVQEVNWLKVRIKTSVKLDADDLIEIHAGDHWVSVTLEQAYHKGTWLKVPETVEVGAEVRRIRSAALNDNIRVDNGVRPTSKINIKADFEVGKPARLTIKDLLGDGHQISIKGDLVQQAMKRALTEKDILKQLKKLGDYPVEIEGIDVAIQGDVFMPVSQINQLRRKGLDKFLGIEEAKTIERHAVSWSKPKNQSRKVKNITVLLNKWYQFETLVQYDVKRVYLEWLNLSDEELSAVRQHPKVTDGKMEIYLALPKIVRHEKDSVLSGLKSKLPDWVNGYLVRSLDAFEYFNLEGKKIHWDFSMNLMNHGAVEQVEGLADTSGYMPSVELTAKEMLGLDLSKAEVHVYGHVTTMTSAQCVYKNLYGCEPLEGRVIKMTDRKGAEVPITTHCKLCYNTLYNPVPVYLLDRVSDFQKQGVAWFRLSFLDEPKSLIHSIMHAALADTAIAPDRLLPSFTRGHYTKGIE